MPNRDINNQHFKVPFEFHEGSAVCVEQDSPDDVAQCVAAIVRTPRGFRLEIPEFGINPPVLIEGKGISAAIESAIQAWEPRAEYTLSERQLEDILSKAIQINVGVRSDV